MDEMGHPAREFADGDRAAADDVAPGSAPAALRGDVGGLLRAGLAQHEDGRLDAAEACYRQVLAARPAHPDALHLLGVVAYQVGRPGIAIELIGAAIRLNRTDPSYHANYGLALQALRRPIEALASFDEALALEPEHLGALVNRSTALEQLGRFEEALEGYDRVLALRPDDAAIMNNRGLVLYLLGHFDEALASYDRALAFRPDDAAALNNRGVVLHRLKRYDEALANCDRMLSLRPDDVEALNNRGEILRALARFPAALDSYDRALTLCPDHPEVLNNRGFLLHLLKRSEEALEAYDRVIELRPDHVAALNNRGAVLRELARAGEALESYDRALALRPDDPELLSNRGNALDALGRFEEALASYERALALRPDDAALLSNRGNALCELDRFGEALEDYARALALRPDDPEVLNNRGNALHEIGHFEAALASFDAALALAPDHQPCRINRAYLLLRTGRFAQGWQDHEWRRNAGNWAGRPRRGPELGKGGRVAGRVLLYSEQGLGDTIQFCRFARIVAAQGAAVSVEVQPALAGLLRSLEGVTVIARGEPLPEYDAHLPLMSLPHVLGINPETMPRDLCYLAAEPARIEAWARRLPRAGFRVGIVWQGNPAARADKGRSIPLRAFAPLCRIPGVTLISLQKGYGVEQLADLPPGMTVETLGSEFDAGPGGFRDSAAIMMNLDLVISSDTSSAHLAGALGCPVWIALTYMPDWRWMIDREDSPWYPTARLFRQAKRGDWIATFERIAAAISSELAGSRPHPISIKALPLSW